MMVGTIILDHKANVLQANANAQRILDAGDGLRVMNQQLVATASADNKKLQRLIKDVLTMPSDKPGVIEALSLARGLAWTRP